MLQDDVRELVRALRRYCDRGAWDGDQENLDAAEALYKLMRERDPKKDQARALVRQIDALQPIGELTLHLQRAAHGWYRETFPSPSSAR